MRANAGTINVRCERITSAGVQCKCWATMRVNSVPYCKVHGEKELRALAMTEAQGRVEKRDAPKGEGKP